MKYLIKNGRVICTKSNIDKVADLLIEDGVIKKIDSCINDDAMVIDATGKIVMAGIVDIHTHLRTPGFEFKEDIVTGTKSALAGGITTAVCMPNTKPTLDSMEVVSKLQDKIKDEALVNVEIISSITKGLKGEQIADLEGNAKLGVVGFSDDGRTTMNDDYMVEAFQRADKLGLPIITHCEDHNKAPLYKDVPSPPEIEYVIVDRDIKLCEKVGGRLHVCHVSVKQAVDYVRQAKKRGARVTCEVTPHHFSLTQEEIDTTDTYTKVNPPIRTKEHLDAVVEGIKDGTIDVIATDHAPHDKQSKEKPYAEAAFGFTGFELAFSLSYTNLVQKGHISLNKMIEMMTSKPAELLKIDAGTLEVGKRADIIIADLDKNYVVDSSKFFSKGKNTPFNGREVSGKVTHTFVNGELRFKEGKICQ